MKDTSRRTFFKSIGAGAAAVVAAGVLAGCTKTVVNGVVTYTIDVAKIDAYANAGIKAGKTILAIPVLDTAIGATITDSISAGLTLLGNFLDDFNTAAKGKVVVNYNDATWKTKIDSILNSMSQINSDIKAGLSGVKSGVSAAILEKANLVANALDTLLSFFEAAIGYVGLSAHSRSMTESQAFSVINS